MDTDDLLNIHTLENCGCLQGPLLNMLHSHMEVFTWRGKSALGSDPLEATGSKVGEWKKLLFFFTLLPNMLG